LIEGRLVFIYAQDPDDQGGIMTPRQAEKIEKIYDMAEKMHAPVIELLDSAGVQVASAMDSLMAFGRVLRRKSELKGTIPKNLTRNRTAFRRRRSADLSIWS